MALFTRVRYEVIDGHVYKILQNVLAHLPAYEAVEKLHGEFQECKFPYMEWDGKTQDKVEIIGGDAFVVREILLSKSTLKKPQLNIGETLDETSIMTQKTPTIFHITADPDIGVVTVSEPCVRMILFGHHGEVGRRYRLSLPQMVFFWKFRLNRNGFPTFSHLYAFCTEPGPVGPQTELLRFCLPNVHHHGAACVGDLDVSNEEARAKGYKTLGHRIDDYFLQFISAGFNDDLFCLPPDVSSFTDWEEQTIRDPKVSLTWDYSQWNVMFPLEGLIERRFRENV